MNLSIHRIPAFQDNYLWLISDISGDAIVVDPGDAAPILRVLEAENLNLVAILATHHHPDHIGGVEELVSRFRCPVYGPDSANIPQVDFPLKEGDNVELLGASFAILEVPGHTLDHIVYYSDNATDSPVLFAGDTLFAGGCGRLFEGTAEQMHKSLTKIANLPSDTSVFCAHEYTLANLRFAVAVEPGNKDVTNRLEEVIKFREQGVATVPTSLALEKETNPFLRAQAPEVIKAAERRLGHTPRSPVETFASIREWKDNF